MVIEPDKTKMSKSYIHKYPVASFFILTFVISWGAILIIFGLEGLPVTKELQEKIGMVILLGPTIAGILLNPENSSLVG